MMHLSGAIKLGSRELKNRLFVPAHASGLFDPDGVATPEALDYYAARIAGGAAMVTIGESGVLPGQPAWGAPISRAANLPFYRELARLAARHNCAVVDQLSASGGQAWWSPGELARAPSAVPHPIGGVRPIEMTDRELRHVMRAFVLAARRSKRAGLFGCEIKADQGKFFGQLLSSHFNRRTDTYGGTFDSRLRLLIETLQAIRTECQGLCVGIRLSIGPSYAGPDDPDATDREVARVAQLLDQNRLVDYVSFSAATNSWPKGYLDAHGDLLVNGRTADDRIRGIRATLSVPVLFAGQFSAVADAEIAISRDICDMAGFARAHIADPDFSAKVLNGRETDIVPCIKCNQGCVGTTWEGRPVRCVSNPATGREGSLSLPLRPHSSQTGRMLVVGGGPAGLECAVTAATLGWRVTICEKSERLGGRLHTMIRSCPSADWEKMLSRYQSLVSRTPAIEVSLNAPFSQFSASNFDEVVFATGREYVTPREWSASPVPTAHIATAWAWLPDIKGKSIIVVDEDPFQGAIPFACHAAQSGASVAVVSTQEHIGKGLDQATLARWIGEARRLGVAALPFTEVHAIEDGRVLLRCVCSGDVRAQPAHGVALGIIPTLPSCQLPARARVVGDARYPRGVQFAVSDARGLILSLSKENRSCP